MKDNVCESCRWWKMTSCEEEKGRCHRHAPTPMKLNGNKQEIDDDDNDDIYTIWPLTFSRDWCGNYTKTLGFLGE